MDGRLEDIYSVNPFKIVHMYQKPSNSVTLEIQQGSSIITSPGWNQTLKQSFNTLMGKGNSMFNKTVYVHWAQY